MKKLIRKKVFESNSSSSHVISLAGEDKEFIMDTIYPDQDGNIIVHAEEFGWSWDKYNDSMTKLAYAFQDNVDRKMLIDVVKEQTGAVNVIFVDSDNGYIDHQSVGTAREMCTNKASTRDFIFNKNSWLFTGNDNSSPNPTFYDVPEIRNGVMIYPKYQYELIIDGMTTTAKFLSEPTDDEIDRAIDSLVPFGTLLSEHGYFNEDDSLYFQLYRERDFYRYDYDLTQNFSTNEILFLKENDRRFHEIKSSYKELRNHENWDEINREITQKAIETIGLVKSVKFTIKKL